MTLSTSSASMEHLLVCVAWPYARSGTHVGQIAGSVLPGDIFARYHRMAGNQVLMISGSDMHGTPITVEADQKDIPPSELALRYHRQMLTTWERLGITFDLYTNTTTENHVRQAQAIFLDLLKKGYIFKDWMDSPYCTNDRRFLPDRYVEGTCPYCGFVQARGDQCDQCGRMLDATQLLDPRCKHCGNQSVEIRATEHFFFDLPQFTEQLRQWLQTNKEYWRPSALNPALNWLKEGLMPRAITRDLDWGVPVPLPGYEGKCLYVWFEAVIGYYSASIEWAKRIGKPDAWKQWWEQPAMGNTSSARSYYFIGKDNIAFHTIFWPAMLLGIGGLALPYDVPASEFMTMRSAKSSASRGNVICTDDALDRYGADSLRYYLVSILPEHHDADFSYEALVRHNNDELVATYGNAVHRVLTFVQHNFDSIVPVPGPLGAADNDLLDELRQAFDSVGAAIASVRLRDGMNTALAVARSANRYLDEQSPWKSLKTDRTSAATTMYVMLQVLNGLKVLFSPYLPFSSQKLHELLGYAGSVSECRWEPATIASGQKLPPPTPLFAKFDSPTT